MHITDIHTHARTHNFSGGNNLILITQSLARAEERAFERGGGEIEVAVSFSLSKSLLLSI